MKIKSEENRCSTFAEEIEKIGLTSYRQVLEMPDQGYIIENLIPANSIAMLYGPSGSFKSFTVIDLLLRTVTGKSWGPNKSKKGAVCYVYGEGGSGLKKRLKAWCKHNNKSLEDPQVIFEPEAVNLFDAQSVTNFIRRVTEVEIQTGVTLDIISFDTLARCTTGAEENNNTHMSIVIDNCEKIKAATGAAILLVHHTGKDKSKSARGASAVWAAADTVISLVKGKGDEVVLDVLKQKDDEPLKNTLIEMEKVEIDDNTTSLVAVYKGIKNEHASANDNLNPGQQLMFDFIKETNDVGAEWADLRSYLFEKGIGKNRSSTFSEYKNKLLKLGYVIEKDGKLYPIK